jgi:hypothetical protein
MGYRRWKSMNRPFGALRTIGFDKPAIKTATAKQRVHATHIEEYP